jgi:hypothetical protein
MSVPDPVTTLVMGAAALQVAKQAQDFVAAASGHPDESIGTILGNIANRRWKNAEAVTSKSHLILLEIGVPPGEIPFNVLQPGLEGASLHESAEMQDKWANMLANAADPRNVNRVEPAFPRILSELSSREVRFLDHLYQEVAGVPHLKLIEGSLFASYHASLASPDGHPFADKARIGLEASATENADREQFQMMLDVLERNRIISRIDMPTATVNSGLAQKAARSLGGGVPVSMSTELHYAFTNLGYAFVRACQKPKK